jgi:uncharacterized repeat protein (TIGR01451 family)
MKTPRRAYRPEVVADLESRLALSHVAAAAAVQHVHQPAERASAKVSTMLRPAFTITWTGSDGGTHVQNVKQSATFGDGLVTSSVNNQLPDSETMAIGVPPNAALVTISFDNTSKTNINSGTITDTLNPGLTLVPGSVPSSSTAVVTTTTEANGVQTVHFNVEGIAANSQGFVQFEVEHRR